MVGGHPLRSLRSASPYAARRGRTGFKPATVVSLLKEEKMLGSVRTPHDSFNRFSKFFIIGDID